MADKTILQGTLDNDIVDGDFLIYWKTASGVQRRVARANLLGATLTGLGTVATGGFTLTVPATGTAMLLSGDQTAAGQKIFTGDGYALGSSLVVFGNVANTSYGNIVVDQFGTLGVRAPVGDALWGALGIVGHSDTFSRLVLGLNTGTPFLSMGPGNAARDVFIHRSAANQLRISSNAGTGSASLIVNSLAGSGNRAVYSDANGTLTNSSSDARLKRDVEPVKPGDALALAMALEPVRFNWIDAERRGAEREIGLIAQQVAEHVPEVVGVNDDGMYALDYAKLTAVLIGAVQNLAARVAELESK